MYLNDVLVTGSVISLFKLKYVTLPSIVVSLEGSMNFLITEKLIVNITKSETVLIHLIRMSSNNYCPCTLGQLII